MRAVTDMRAAEPALEEQSVWNRWMRDGYARRGSSAGGSAGNVVDELMARRCLRFAHQVTGEHVDVWPLNPNLFPNFPVYAKLKQPEAVLEPPFIVHFNWLYGIPAKESNMRETGHWLVGGE